MTIGEIVTSMVARIVFVIIILGLLYAWGPDILDYLIDRYDKWQDILNRIRRRRDTR